MNTPESSADSVRARYVVTLFAQGFRLLLSFATAALVPRTLGPVGYGNYAFLISTSSTLRGITDNGAQQAFFTFSAQEEASGPLVRLYAVVLALQFLLVMALLAVLLLFGRADLVWHGQHVDQIVLVTAVEWMTFLSVSLQQLGDSKGRTVRLQVLGVVGSALLVIALLTLWATGRLDFYSFAFANLIGAAITCGLLAWWLFARNGAIFWRGALDVRRYLGRWWRFARPLLLLQYYLPLVTFAAIYLLQRWYGAREQAYYSLALQWSTFALLFTTAGMWIFWREIANRNAAGDATRVAAIYSRFSASFMFLATVLAGWLSGASGSVVELVAGPAFAPAAPVLALMALYPVAQTLGQLTTASLKATERTRTFARLSVVLSVPDLALTWLLLAPRSAAVPGLELGALGVALKTAVYGLINVHVFDWINSRLLGVDFRRALLRRLAALLLVGLLAWATLGAGTPALSRLGVPPLIALGLSSAAYFAAVLLLVIARPVLAGIERAELSAVARQLGMRMRVFVRRNES